MRAAYLLIVPWLVVTGCQSSPSSQATNANSKPPQSAAEKVQSAIQSLADRLTITLPPSRTPRVSLLPIADLSGSAISPFTATLYEGLHGALQQTGRVIVAADATDFQAVMGEMQAQAIHAAVLQPDTRKKVGALLKAEALVRTSITRVGQDFQVQCGLLDVAKGIWLGSANVFIPSAVVYGSDASSEAGLRGLAVLPFRNEYRPSPSAGESKLREPNDLALRSRTATDELARELGARQVVSGDAVDQAVGEIPEPTGAPGADRFAVAVGFRVGARYVIGGTIHGINFESTQQRLVTSANFTSTAAVAHVQIWVVQVWNGRVTMSRDTEGRAAIRGSVKDASVDRDLISRAVIDSIRQLRNDSQFHQIVASAM